MSIGYNNQWVKNGALGQCCILDVLTAKQLVGKIKADTMKLLEICDNEKTIRTNL